MSDKKNVEKKALNKNNLENVSGGMVYELDGKWIASNIDLREYGSLEEFGKRNPLQTFYIKKFDTKEEALEYDKGMRQRMELVNYHPL